MSIYTKAIPTVSSQKFGHELDTWLFVKTALLAIAAGNLHVCLRPSGFFTRAGLANRLGKVDPDCQTGQQTRFDAFYGKLEQIL